MKIDHVVLLEMTKEEAWALKNVLGKQSDVDYISYKLSQEQIDFLHELYNDLPDEPEEE